MSGRYLDGITKVPEDVWRVSACCKEGSGEYIESQLKSRSSQDRCNQDRSNQEKSRQDRSSQDKLSQERSR